MVDDYILDKVLNKIKKLDDAKILVHTDDKLPDVITLKIVLIIMTCVIKNGDKFYPQLFLEEALYDE